MLSAVRLVIDAVHPVSVLVKKGRVHTKRTLATAHCPGHHPVNAWRLSENNAGPVLHASTMTSEASPYLDQLCLSVTSPESPRSDPLGAGLNHDVSIDLYDRWPRPSDAAHDSFRVRSFGVLRGSQSVRRRA
jgi:hypothetical protein